MKLHKKLIFAPAFIALLSLFLSSLLQAQNSMPEALEEGTLEEQFNYLHERTRIYNNFRAIREDMFQKIRSNSNDSLEATKMEIARLEEQISGLDSLIASLESDLQQTNLELEQAIKNRDRLTFLGIPMHKVLYNSILWIIIGALAFLTVVFFLANRRNQILARRCRKDLEEIKEEFEAHRKKARERYEQAVVKHHNEMRKLKGN